MVVNSLFSPLLSLSTSTSSPNIIFSLSAGVMVWRAARRLETQHRRGLCYVHTSRARCGVSWQGERCAGRRDRMRHVVCREAAATIICSLEYSREDSSAPNNHQGLRTGPPRFGQVVSIAFFFVYPGRFGLSSATVSSRRCLGASRRARGRGCQHSFSWAGAG